VGSLKDLRAALRNYKPTKKGETFKEMQEYLESLVEDIEVALEEPERKLLLIKAEKLATKDDASAKKKSEENGDQKDEKAKLDDLKTMKEPSWAPDVKLDKDWWTRDVLDKAVKGNGTDKLEDGADVKATTALISYDMANTALAKNATPESKDYQAVIDLVEAVAKEFRAYKPVKLDKAPHDDMLLITAKMAALADHRRLELTAKMNEAAKKGSAAQSSQKGPEDKPAEVKTEKPTGDKSTTTDTANENDAPPPAPLVLGDLSNPNPFLYFIENNAKDKNFRVDSRNPGPGWQQVYQFCAYLATHWLVNDLSGGLKFSDLPNKEPAVQTLKDWGNSTGLPVQVNYACGQIHGSEVSKKELLEGVAKGYAASTKIWFGDHVHSQAATVQRNGDYLVYDPNTGDTRKMSKDDFAGLANGQSAFVLKPG